MCTVFVNDILSQRGNVLWTLIWGVVGRHRILLKLGGKCNYVLTVFLFILTAIHFFVLLAENLQFHSKEFYLSFWTHVSHTLKSFSFLLLSQVNDEKVESYTHDELIEVLKNAGDVVTLTVKYFRPAAIFLNKSLQSGMHVNFIGHLISVHTWCFHYFWKTRSQSQNF